MSEEKCHICSKPLTSTSEKFNGINICEECLIKIRSDNEENNNLDQEKDHSHETDNVNEPEPIIEETYYTKENETEQLENSENNNDEVKHKIKKIFHDPNEKRKGILGESYLTSILNNEGVSKTAMILTDKRLYQTGKIYELRKFGTGFEINTGKKIVPLADITGTTYRIMKKPMWFVLGILEIGLGIGLLESTDNISIIFILLGLAFFIVGFFAREKYFIVEYAGGSVGVPCKWYKDSSIENFQKAISIEKDKLSKYSIK